MNENDNTQPMGLQGAENGEAAQGAGAAPAPAWAGRQCLQDAADCIASAREAVQRVDTLAALGALALALESVVDALAVTQ